MFIAMNRFRVLKDATRDFEQVWLTRESYLDQVPGFVEMLWGRRRADGTIVALDKRRSCPMPKPADLNRCLAALDQDRTIIAVIESAPQAQERKVRDELTDRAQAA